MCFTGVTQKTSQKQQSQRGVEFKKNKTIGRGKGTGEFKRYQIK